MARESRPVVPGPAAGRRCITSRVADFGPLQEGGARRYFREGGFEEGRGLLSRHPEITVVSNLDEDGNPVRENAGLGSGEVVWHSDNSYVETPPAGSMLYAIEIPEGGGGDTSFANQYIAYETLPEIMLMAINGKQQRHDSSRNSAGVLRPTAKLPTTPEEVEGPAHPLVRIHPETGRRALYLDAGGSGRRTTFWICRTTGGKLLDRLWYHATRNFDAQLATGRRTALGQSLRDAPAHEVDHTSSRPASHSNSG